MKKIGFFEEKAGEQSMMRLLSFLSFFVAVFIAIYSITTKQPGVAIDVQTMTFFGFFMVGAFVPKAVQKFAEMKSPKEAAPAG
jgi:hypothetical protein